MKPTNRLFLFLLIFLIVSGTVPAANALAAGTDFDTAEEIFCDDLPLYNGEIKEVANPNVDPAQEDYWKVSLVAGQELTIDIDALESGSSDLDSLLQVFNEQQALIGMNDQSSEIPLNEDPYLEIRADVDGDYYLVISASSPRAGADTGTYSFSIKCSDPSIPPAPVDPVKVGDLLGSTGAKIGSLVTINPTDGTSNVRFPSVTGPIADIEYQYSTHTLFLAVYNDPGAVIAIDPDTGMEGPVINVALGAVIALEDAAGILYGVHVVVDDYSGEEQYSLVTIDQSTGELAFLVSLGQQSISALAYHSAEKILYGAVPGTTGADLVKIDLTSLEIETVGPTGLGHIVALDFSHDNILYGVELSGTLFYVSDLTTGQAEKIAAIDVSTEVVTTVTTATSAAPTGVSGLTFVVGEPPDDEPVKIMCSSTLASQMAADSASADHKLSKFKLRNRLRSGAVALFKFQAAAGENIIIRLMPEVEEVAATEEESSISELETSWPRWHWKGEGRLFLGLRDAIPGVKIRERTKGTLPLELEVGNLAEGQYYILVIQPLFRYNKVDYCLTLESDYEDSQAWESLEVAWPSDDSEDDTASTSAAEPEDAQKSTETLAGESEDNGPVPVALSTTAIAPTSAPPEEPVVVTPVEADPVADGGDPKIVQTLAETPVVEPVAEIPVVEPATETPVVEPVAEIPVVEPATETPVVEPVAETPVVEPAAETPVVEPVAETPVVEPVVETPVVEPVAETPVVEPVAEIPVVTEPAADDGSDVAGGDDSPPAEEYSDDPMEDPPPMKG